MSYGGRQKAAAATAVGMERHQEHSLATMETRWIPNIHAYKEQRAIKFLSEEALDGAIDLFWTDPRLWGAPRVPVGDETLIVPAGVIPLLRQKLQFTESRVAHSHEFSAKQLGEMRRQAKIRY